MEGKRNRKREKCKQSDGEKEEGWSIGNKERKYGNKRVKRKYIKKKERLKKRDLDTSKVSKCCTPYIMDSLSSMLMRASDRSAPISVTQSRLIPFA